MKAGSELIVALACVAALAPVAAAQPSGQVAAATAQFDKGRAFLKDKKYAEACAAFEQSQKLDPQNGTLYNLAGCYTHVGKLASAWAAYKELAQVDTNDKRKKDSVKQAAVLEKRLPKLVLKAATPPAGLAVTLDGLDVTGLVGSDNPIDLGEHKVHATAPKLADFDTTINITDEGKTVTVAIAFAAPRGREPTPIKPIKPIVPAEPAHVEPVAHTEPDHVEPVDHAEPTKSHRKLYGIIVAAGGGALVATGLVFGQLANGKWSDAKKLCGDDLTCDNDADLMKGNKLVSDARSQANLSTALTIGGAVAVGVGIVLMVTAPEGAPKDGGATSTAWRLTPTAGPGAMGLDLSGRF